MKNKSVSWIGGMMVIGLGIGASIGATLDKIPVGAGCGIALGLVIGAFADKIRKSKESD